MTDTMEQIESRVKGTVDTTVENVRRTFDIKQQISDKPWAALGIAVVAGYVLGSMDGSSEVSNARSNTSDHDPLAQGYTASTPHKPGLLDDIMTQFGDELNVLKSAAVAVGVNMLRDTIQQNVPQLAKVYQRTQQEIHPTVSPSSAAPIEATNASRETVGLHLNGGVHS